jgi:hypothetical protein
LFLLRGFKMNKADELAFISLHEYALRRGVSMATVKREIKAGNGPKLTQLSKRRVGIRLDHYREDCDRRVRRSPRPPPAPQAEAL